MMSMCRSALLLVTACLVASCSLFTPAAPSLQTFRLDYPAPAPLAETAPAAVLRLAPFGIAAAYDQPGFVYRDGPYELGVDHYHRWIAAPQDLITDLVARDLAAARVVAAVLQGPSGVPAQYELSGQIEALEETPRGGCSAELRLRALLVRLPDTGPRAVVFEEVFSAEAPCEAGDPASFAEAMSLATQRVSAALLARIATALS
jgi:ABC-type uncharacterized transport system auxiliary subunit